jgi:hypothetical protein
VRRIERRAQARAWRARNRERVRACERTRYAKLKAARPHRLAELRAYHRAWRRLHPRAGRDSRLRWRRANADKVRAQRRRFYWKHRREALAANRA